MKTSAEPQKNKTELKVTFSGSSHRGRVGGSGSCGRLFQLRSDEMEGGWIGSVHES